MADETDFGDQAAIAELKSAGKDSRWALTENETAWETDSWFSQTPYCEFNKVAAIFARIFWTGIF